MRVCINIGMPYRYFTADTVIQNQVHVHRLQLGQGIDPGQFDQPGMADAKAGIGCINVLQVEWAGLLANEPEWVAGNLIGTVRDSLNLDRADRDGNDLDRCGCAGSVSLRQPDR